MNQKALKTLEYDKIIHRLTGHAASAGAKERCEKLQPSSSLWEIERAQTQTADALRRVYQKGSVSFGGISADPSSVSRLAAFSAWANCAKSCLFWRPLTK